ncbi:MAG: hypothetical protein H5T69_17645, partial [Chloroflexi bacterium]|nr:hypothetical protein [Chloroflexota bacterium]
FFKGTNYKDYATCFGNYGLYVYTVEQVKRLILAHRFELEDIYAHLSPINTARLPGILKDLFTWHVCYLATKPDAC